MKACVCTHLFSRTNTYIQTNRTHTGTRLHERENEHTLARRHAHVPMSKRAEDLGDRDVVRPTRAPLRHSWDAESLQMHFTTRKLPTLREVQMRLRRTSDRVPPGLPTARSPDRGRPIGAPEHLEHDARGARRLSTEPLHKVRFVARARPTTIPLPRRALSLAALGRGTQSRDRMSRVHPVARRRELR
jgi:hypothetical protein